MKLGTDVPEPKLPTFELTVAKVSEVDTAAEPFTELKVAVASPVKDKSRAVAQVVAVVELPLNAP